MDESLKLKKVDRELAILEVEKQLIKFSKEVSYATLDCFSTGKYIHPDIKAWARKIIATVKEHSI